ncbi:NADH dehydrogenase [ubiquinone] 1 beta subcomplex subunit 7 [Cricetulus griseus]|uniref:NADH dehydrogenase [ubiquinone] 1 beta subcomplex subunit 7 n=1 Tax=Cricetulus griseus TaxID=10029 RepID=G3ID13_CRIGR|nr:NADH dehydrogenase [ubiquinone] 1 beta subcomplex subunit 7 [Cricetulus griseus]EGW14123.1 NADH dehydrogenase [ubiquinone] 1 beta subcomplex subunit 7 [Cricetulus griseus]
MGAHLAWRYVGDASVETDPLQMPSFPEHKEHVRVATQQEMNDAQLTLQQHDYCAHYLIRLPKCKRDSFPNFLACKHEQHDWHYCDHLDYVKREANEGASSRSWAAAPEEETEGREGRTGQGVGEVGPEVAL